jgi:hypothetical protein
MDPIDSASIEHNNAIAAGPGGNSNTIAVNGAGLVKPIGQPIDINIDVGLDVRPCQLPEEHDPKLSAGTDKKTRHAQATAVGDAPRTSV